MLSVNRMIMQWTVIHFLDVIKKRRQALKIQKKLNILVNIYSCKKLDLRNETSSQYGRKNSYSPDLIHSNSSDWHLSWLWNGGKPHNKMKEMTPMAHMSTSNP